MHCATALSRRIHRIGTRIGIGAKKLDRDIPSCKACGLHSTRHEDHAVFELSAPQVCTLHPLHFSFSSSEFVILKPLGSRSSSVPVNDHGVNVSTGSPDGASSHDVVKRSFFNRCAHHHLLSQMCLMCHLVTVFDSALCFKSSHTCCMRHFKTSLEFI